ncbi:Uncharacterised protein [Serratia fonticola]|uniref:hypothetical protein n=1 Tax=Serratia fonticola TaxID=47917 RepID=UPI00217CA15C|nr:hypothetical protein [Serratia fonticola]CAI1588573.1 Uncharacterised protein [Serratia fonticola]
MTKSSNNAIDDQNALVAELDRQLNESINNSQLEAVEALLVVMERFFSLYDLTVPSAPQQRH